MKKSSQFSVSLLLAIAGISFGISAGYFSTQERNVYLHVGSPQAEAFFPYYPVPFPIPLPRGLAPFRNRFDVNGDGIVSALDVLIIINHLNQQGGGPAPDPNQPPYMDVDGDGDVDANDALEVIMYINNGGLIQTTSRF